MGGWGDTQADGFDARDLEDVELINRGLGIRCLETQFQKITIDGYDPLMYSILLMGQDNGPPIGDDSILGESIGGFDGSLLIAGCEVFSPQDEWNALSMDTVW